MRIKSQPQKHSEEYQETIDVLSIEQSSSPESNESQNCLEPLYEVESIIMKQINKDESQYLVKWKGYSELTWEPLSSLQNCQLLLEEFDQQQTSKDVIITTKSLSKKTITKSQKSKKNQRNLKREGPLKMKIKFNHSKIQEELLKLMELRANN